MFEGSASKAASAPAKSKAPSHFPYLLPRRNALFFRIRIPAEIQACLGRTEYRRSLGRCYASEAKVRALKLATAAFEVFSFAREVVQARRREGAAAGVGKSVDRYTTHAPNQEKRQMSQEISSNWEWYTREFRGRALSSLTDEEIRSIAETVLLMSLKGLRLMQTKAGKEAMRRALGISPEELAEAKKTLATLSDEGEHLDEHAAPPLSDDDIEGRAQKLSKTWRITSELGRRALMSGETFIDAAYMTDCILKYYGIDTDPETERAEAMLAVPPVSSLPYVKAYNEMVKISTTASHINSQTALGDYTEYDEITERLEEKFEKRLEKRLEKRRIKVGFQQAQVQVQQPARPAAIPAGVQAAEAPPSLTLSEAIEEMCREKTLEDWKPKVAVGERYKLELFKAIIDPEGTLAVRAITARHLTKYKEMLHLMPASRGKKKEYRDMDLPAFLRLVEAGKVPADIRMEANTKKTYCQSVTAFIKWAGRREYHDKPSITELLHIKAEKQAHEYRDPYTDSEIVRLFAPEQYATASNPSRFWVPLLGLFTGARLEELAQLHTDDLVLVNRQDDARKIFISGQPMMDAAAVKAAEENGETLCLFINKGKPYQRLKTASSRRYVPLSPVLAHELGLLNYAASIFRDAEQARAQGGKPFGEGRLFPELTRKKETDNFAHSLSKWFNTYRTKVGVLPQDGGGKKDFHSFRHTMARWCEQNGVPEKSAARHLGHSHDTMTFGRYSTDTAPFMLYESITKGFGEYARHLLDLDGLKASKWAGDTANDNARAQ